MHYPRMWESYFPQIKESYLRAMQGDHESVGSTPTVRSPGARQEAQDVPKPNGRNTHKERSCQNERTDDSTKT